MLGRIKCFSISVLLSALIGCGGEDVSTNDRDVEDHGVIDNVSVGGKAQMIAAPIAQDQFSKILLGEDPDSNRIISLKEGVSDPQGLPVTLEQVVSLSSDCATPTSINAKELSFVVKENEPDVCHYQYIVKNHSDEPKLDKTSTADSIVLISSEEKTIALSTVSGAAEVDQEIDIDLEAELGGEFPGDNYVLDDEIIVLGSGNAIVDTVTNTITYSALEKGIATLYYTLKKVDDVSIAFGRVDVAVSNTNAENTPPEAESFSGPQSIDINTEITVDVADHIKDDDGDVLQLIDVYALNATVKPYSHDTDGEHISNTQFTFISDSSGTFDVSYYVNDHRGGYATAVVHISVQSSIPWGDIAVNDSETYTTPWEKEAANGPDANINYDGTATEMMFVDGVDKEYEIPLFTHSRAEALCALNGMVLPTEVQLTTLFQSFNGEPVQGNDGNHWPVSRNYWSSDETKSVSLSNGSVSIEPEGSETLAIVTCVYPGSLSAEVTIRSDEVYALNPEEAVSDRHYHTIEATVMNQGGTPQQGAMVYFASRSPLTATPSNAKTDENGQVIFNVSSEESGVFDASMSYFTQRVDVALIYLENVIQSLKIFGSNEVIVGQEIHLTAEAIDSQNNSSDVTKDANWRSENDAIATVDKGVVIGNALGKVTISAEYSDVSDEMEIHVVDSFGKEGYVEITPSSSTLDTGDNNTQTLTAKIYTVAYPKPEGKDITDDPSTTWTLEGDNNETGSNDIGRLDKNVFTALNAGKTTVHVKYEIGETGEVKSDSAPVIVEAAEPKNIFEIEGRTEVAVNDYMHLVAKLDGIIQTNPLGHYNVIFWSSSNPNIAGVDQGGYVTGKAIGDVTITATLKDESIDVEPITYNVTVVPEPWGGDYIKIIPSSVTLEVNDSQSFKIRYYSEEFPTGVERASAIWSLNEPDGDIGFLDGTDGNVFNATNAGSGIITASVYSSPTQPPITSTATIVVEDSVPTLTSVEIRDTEDAEILSDGDTTEIEGDSDHIQVGQTFGYKAVAKYSDSTSVDITNNATWTSSDNGVADFNVKAAGPGVVTGLKAGKTTIKVSYTKDGVTQDDTTPLTVINPIPDGTFESVGEKASVGEYIAIRALFINKETGDSSYVYPTFKPTITSGNGVLSQEDDYWVITASSVGKVQVNMEYNGLTTTNTYHFADDNDISPSYDIILGMRAFKKEAPPVPGWCQLSGAKTQILLSGTATYFKYKSDSGIAYEDDYYYRPASEQNCLSYHSYNTFVDTMITTQYQIENQERGSGTLKAVLFDYFATTHYTSKVIKGADVLVQYQSRVMQLDGGFYACKKEGEATVRFTLDSDHSKAYEIDYSCR